MDKPLRSKRGCHAMAKPLRSKRFSPTTCVQLCFNVTSVSRKNQ